MPCFSSRGRGAKALIEDSQVFEFLPLHGAIATGEHERKYVRAMSYGDTMLLRAFFSAFPFSVVTPRFALPFFFFFS